MVIELTWLILIAVALLILALSAFSLSKRMSSKTGLPEGELVYSDTGFAVGKLAPTSRNDLGEKQERPLVSERFGLTGKPDYLVKTREGVVPVEAKSASLPASGRPHDSHIFQLAAYCLLVEEALNAPVPYGIIRYRDGEVAIDYTPELKESLLDILDEIREARGFDEVHRSHDEARRCYGCYMREVCDEAL